MRLFIEDIESENRHSQITCLSVAVTLHLALLMWNPVLMREAWKTMTGLGDGSVMIVNVPGPLTAVRPGAPEAQRPIARMPGLPRVALMPVSAPTLASRTYHAIRAPLLPPESDLSLPRGPSAMSIVIGKEAPLSQPIPTVPALLPNRTRISMVNPFGQGGTLRGEGGTGRILIRTEPAVISESLETPDRYPRAQVVNSPSIEGPLANRAVLQRVIPDYPAWAEEQGIMGTVRLYFTVDSQGHVRATIRLEQTSGYPALDQLAMDTLRQWRFSASASDPDSQWGVISFIFALSRTSPTD